MSTISLKAEGFNLSFGVNCLRSNFEYANLIVTFQLDSHLGNVFVQSEPTSIATKDLLRLVTYFEQHIVHLQQDPWSDSDAFVNTELGFQIQALAGELVSPNEGEFGIQCMVNVGKSYEDGPRVYIGGEANVTLEQIKTFTDSIGALLAELAVSV